ncbi:hypothetical protein [Planococcus versutus]|uniref:Uncharacterized protein n=1 Tax=Planococcus versutus TaxID=1302659 RepID=A0A1B1S3A1_9BACL|nr:hypothetical protein [Planococcus versutus]ANU27665.1 hypothetical protein I858_011775 [Planococcus versutus]
MNEQQKDIEEFIKVIKEDLMEIYKVSDKQAISVLNDFKLRELIDKHGELVAHYPSQELAKMAYEKKRPVLKLNPNNKLEQEAAEEYIGLLISEIKARYQLSDEETVNLMIDSRFVELFQEDPYFYFHYQPEVVAEQIYNSKR